MKYAVGDIVYNQVTKEEGRIVRITEVNDEDAYIVTLPGSGNGELRCYGDPQS